MKEENLDKKIELLLDSILLNNNRLENKSMLKAFIISNRESYAREQAIEFAEYFKHKYCSSMGEPMDEEYDEWLKTQEQ